jgi:hypothetical protein
MGSHRRKALILSARDVLVLAVCALGLITAWLAYGAGGFQAGAGQAVIGQEGASTSGLGPPQGQAATPPSATPPSATASVVPASPSSATASVAPARAKAAGGNARMPAAAVKPAASAPQRITFPAADLDVVVHPLNPGPGDAQSRSIVPPETKDGYWLQPFGVPGAGSVNTTYIIGHSWLDQDAPFNHLSKAAAPGGLLSVTTATGVLRYRVDSVTTYTKSTLKDSPVWQAVPGRLVLISCFTEDPWGRNVVVVASPLPAR